ncbi:lipase [Fragilaria crotonensis]|nr:lipase [Fragilaria crotonensis]
MMQGSLSTEQAQDDAHVESHDASQSLNENSGEGDDDLVSVIPRVSQPSLRHEIESIKDHFTLPSQSSTIRLRSSVLRVFPDTNSTNQFVLESRTATDGMQEISMKRMHDSSYGIYALRASYSFVAVYLAGILAVYAISFIFNLMTDLVIHSGGTSASMTIVTPSTIIGIFLSFPVVTYGLASCLVYCGSFISDTWMGSPLLKRYTFSNFSDVLFQWVLFFAFIGLPLLVMCGCLLAKSFDWWTITLMTWFCSVACLFCTYTFTVAYFETQACWNLASSIGVDGQTFWQTCRTDILLHQSSAYSGYKKVRYLAEGPTDAVHGGEREIIRQTYVEKRSFYTRLSMSSFCLERLKIFKVLEEPYRLVTVSEAQGVSSFLTASSWSLEKVFCQGRSDRLVTVIKGPDALTRPQMVSSVVCSVLGQVLVMLIVASILVYFSESAAIAFFFVAIALGFWIIPYVIRFVRLYKTVSNLSETLDPDDVRVNVEFSQGDAEYDVRNDNVLRDNPAIAAPGVAGNDGVFQVQDTFRLTQPTQSFSWVMFSLEVAFFFIWPVCSLYQIGNTRIAIEFMFMAIFAFLRRFWNPATALQEVGTITLANRNHDNDDWRRLARISRILDDVTVNRGRFHWMAILSFIMVTFLFICFLAIACDGSVDPYSSAFETETFLPDFEYAAADELPYPTCTIADGFLPDVQEARLADYAFLAYMGYKDDSILQGELDSWFGEGVAKDMYEEVRLYREATFSENIPVSYKLIKFKNGPSVVSIRGTFLIWDLFADAQLWMVAALTQTIRAVLPLGFLWTPILDLLVAAVSALQSEALQNIAFYKETTAFVEYLQKSNSSGTVTITGHSLGGGLAIISAAQTGAPAVAISGPNAMLSRLTFEPPLSEDALNRFTFNVIPHKDPIPMIDDVAMLYQKIKCTASPNRIFACHQIERTICELLVTCGSSGRPPFCKCVTDFSYPKPIQMGNRTFEEACGIPS